MGVLTVCWCGHLYTMSVQSTPTSAPWCCQCDPGALRSASPWRIGVIAVTAGHERPEADVCLTTKDASLFFRSSFLSCPNSPYWCF